MSLGINAGAVFIINDLFCRLLSHPEIKSNIGDASKESYVYDLKNYYTNVEDVISRGHNGNYKFHVPKDLTRKNYARHLINIALHFIFEHELSHILFGHLDFIEEKHGVNKIAEFNSELFFKNNLDLQTLEMDADCTSLARCCISGISNFRNQKNIHSDFLEFYKEERQVLSDINFAISNVLILFGDKDYYYTKPGKSSHPDPLIRQLMIMSTFDKLHLSWKLESDLKKLQSSLVNEFGEVNKGYQLLTKNKINIDAFEPEYYGKNPLPKMVEDNWKQNIREKLIKHTFKPLAE